MAPFSMKCTTCGEYIYKGRKFNARKEQTDEKYYNISIIRFYIRCTRCAAEITFKTDPKNMDYECERGARRNFEVWREAKLAEETEEERLDRLEREEAERDPMKELESKALDAKTEMQISDSLDQIRTRNARVERGERAGVEAILGEAKKDEKDEEKERQEREDAEAARLAFQAGTGDKTRRLNLEEADPDVSLTASTQEAQDDRELMPPPSFTRTKKKKKDFGAALGIKKKVTA